VAIVDTLRAVTLQHVSLEIRRADAPAELRFWNLLGFLEVEPPGALGNISAWVQRGATQIHLLFDDDPVVPPGGHAAVVAEDFDATVAALRAAGYDPEEHERHWGAARAFVHSPTGHRVELMAEPPPA
jgi:catechol 2,3-dioxygenase-like lactoylglutathione lyase family enzyme